MINKNENKNNIAKALESRGDLSEKENLKKLASETSSDEFILDLSTGLLKEFEKALKQNPKLKFNDWYKSRRQKLNEGGVAGDTLAEGYGDLIDAWVRKIDVMENESLTEYINRIRAAEKKDQMKYIKKEIKKIKEVLGKCIADKHIARAKIKILKNKRSKK